MILLATNCPTSSCHPPPPPPQTQPYPLSSQLLCFFSLLSGLLLNFLTVRCGETLMLPRAVLSPRIAQSGIWARGSCVGTQMCVHPGAPGWVCGCVYTQGLLRGYVDACIPRGSCVGTQMCLHPGAPAWVHGCVYTQGLLHGYTDACTHRELCLWEVLLFGHCPRSPPSRRRHTSPR